MLDKTKSERLCQISFSGIPSSFNTNTETLEYKARQQSTFVIMVSGEGRFSWINNIYGM